MNRKLVKIRNLEVWKCTFQEDWETGLWREQNCETELWYILCTAKEPIDGYSVNRQCKTRISKRKRRQRWGKLE
jgi:hypothetical protein